MIADIMAKAKLDLAIHSTRWLSRTWMLDKTVASADRQELGGCAESNHHGHQCSLVLQIRREFKT